MATNTRRPGPSRASSVRACFPVSGVERRTAPDDIVDPPRLLLPPARQDRRQKIHAAAGAGPGWPGRRTGSRGRAGWPRTVGTARLNSTTAVFTTSKPGRCAPSRRRVRAAFACPRRDRDWRLWGPCFSVSRRRRVSRSRRAPPRTGPADRDCPVPATPPATPSSAPAPGPVELQRIDAGALRMRAVALAATAGETDHGTPGRAS